MSPELELLDQLLGHDEPLALAIRLFPTPQHAQLAVMQMLRAGDIQLINQGGSVLATWACDQIGADLASWNSAIQHFRLRITDAGARRIA